MKLNYKGGIIIVNNPPRSQLNYCIWRYFCEITWSQGSRLKKYPSILEGHLVSQEGLMCGPVTSFLTPKSSLCPFFCRLFDLPSLFAVIQEALVTFLGEIHHWDIIHSNSFWARNKKCLKARGFKQTLQRQLLGPAEREQGGQGRSAGPGENKE